MYRQKAISNLKKYTAVKIISLIVAILFYAVSVIVFEKWIIPEMVFAIVIMNLINSVFYRRYILNPLEKEMNAYLFYDIVYEGKFFGPSAVFQIEAEYYTGAYKNAISICNQKLEDPKAAKKYKYHYLTYLALSYFTLDDEEDLRTVCERFLAEVAKEPERKAKKIKSQFSIFSFYLYCLNKEYDVCISGFGNPDDPLSSAMLPLDQIRNRFFLARLYLCKGEKEIAEKYFKEVIEKAPNINYAECSRKGLEAIEKGISYKDTFEIDGFSEEFEIKPQPRLHKIFSKIRLSIIVLMIAAAVVGVTASVIVQFQNGWKDDAEQTETVEGFKEDIRKIIEKTYDDVEIVDVFLLEYEGETVESVYVAKTSTHLVIGSVYKTVESNQRQCDVDIEILCSDLTEEQGYIQRFIYPCTYDNYWAYWCIYSDATYNPPANYQKLIELKIGETKVYIAVYEPEIDT